MRRFRVAFLLSLSFALGYARLSAATIVSVTGPESGGRPMTGSGAHLAFSWISAAAHDGVEISATLASFTTLAGAGNIYNGTAYLMTQIGPGTTAANELAHSDFVFPGGLPFPGTKVSFFSGLTLGAGTYFLVLTGYDTPICNSSIGCGLSVETDTPLLTTGAGISGVIQWISTGPGYAPALQWMDRSTGPQALLFDVSSVPEPESVLLLFFGVMFISFVRSRFPRR